MCVHGWVFMDPSASNMWKQEQDKQFHVNHIVPQYVPQSTVFGSQKGYRQLLAAAA